MKAIFALAVLLVVLACSRFVPVTKAANAQVSSPAYVCQFGPNGQNSASPCAQYIVEIVPARLGGGIIVYQATDAPLDVSTITTAVVASGSVSSGASAQVFLPNSSTQTVTISVGQP